MNIYVNFNYYNFKILFEIKDISIPKTYINDQSLKNKIIITANTNLDFRIIQVLYSLILGRECYKKASRQQNKYAHLCYTTKKQ